MRTIGIGNQDFEGLRMKNCFYVDKSLFIREWWKRNDEATLITRPRRFGKTLNLSMVECFFSSRFAGRGDLFEGLRVWEDGEMRGLQGTFPVLFLSFAEVKERKFEDARYKICWLLENLYQENNFLLEGDLLSKRDREYFERISADMNDGDAAFAIQQLCGYLYRYFGKKVIVLLDEYDTPMQEAYVHGYWEELTAFIRNLFHSAFKTNPYLERGLMTGITRISKESVFSDLNNLNVVTTTSREYADCFGFTEEEVFSALEEYGYGQKKDEVKRWYDGFIFGNVRDVYNPWSIINFLDKGKLKTYWVNTSGNSLVSRLIREGSGEVKIIMEDLLKGKSFHVRIDEQIIFDQLDHSESAIWSLLLAAGYLKAENYSIVEGWEEYDLSLTNMEVRLMFEKLIGDWFSRSAPSYNSFVKALLCGDVEAMNEYMNRVVFAVFSYFDTGRGRSGGMEETERFYHGFVLGLMVELEDRYVITSNRESGFGRYDVVLEPKNIREDAIILEFKIHRPNREKSLEETVMHALAQIDEKQYAAELLRKGYGREQIRKYGVAFQGKKVLIGQG